MSGRQCPGPAQPSPHSLSAALPFTAATTGAQASRATDGEKWEHAAQGRGAALRGMQGHIGAFRGPAWFMRGSRDAMIQECCEQRLTASLCALFDVQTAGDCATMSSLLQPIFEENKVDIYFAGHDHNLQFINKSQVRVLQQNKQAEQCATASEIGITLSLRHLTGGNPRCTISIPRGIWSRIRRAHWCS
eukprot:1156609-Pelagomonas_calceolata.AAC.3